MVITHAAEVCSLWNVVAVQWKVLLSNRSYLLCYCGIQLELNHLLTLRTGRNCCVSVFTWESRCKHGTEYGRIVEIHTQHLGCGEVAQCYSTILHIHIYASHF